MITESIFMQFANSFNEADLKEKDSGYYLIGLAIPMKLLYGLYLKFITEEIPPIENIPTEQKQKYLTIAKKYYTDLKDQIKASKAAYVLSLITSNE